MGLTYIGCPTYDGRITQETHVSLHFPSKQPTKQRIMSGSLLAHNFNLLFCAAMNSRPEVSHFALIHADISAEAWWLDKMLAEMQRVEVQALAVLIPMKGDEGLTSTAIDTPHDGKQPQRRITLAEAHQLPETFTHADVSKAFMSVRYPGALLPNTGLLLLDLASGAFDDFPGFGINDRIERDADGQFQAIVEPEDWSFGRWCGRAGVKVAVTRKVQVNHLCATEPLPNGCVWGTWERDEAWFRNLSLDVETIAP